MRPKIGTALFFGWACAAELTQIVATLKISHQRMSGEVAVKLADLKSRGSHDWHSRIGVVLRLFALPIRKVE